MPERTINVFKDPYAEGFDTCEAETVTIRPGFTVLVGCNGTGKTTMLMNIREELKKQGIPCHSYNNLHDGGHNAIGSAIANEDFAFAATAMGSSEGENISMNLTGLLKKFREFIETGRITDKTTRISDLFHEYKIPETKERWLLLDAVDSGYSVDNVVDAKFVFKEMIKNAAEKGYDLNIVASANEYELAREEQCLDVNTGEYVDFPDYDSYREFILETRRKKEERWKKLEEDSKRAGS